MKRFFFVIAVSFIGAGCAANPAAFFSIHQVDLGKNEIYTRPADFDIANSSVFEDSTVKIKFGSSPPGIGVAIENKSDTSLYINWDGAAYVDVEGTSHRVVHSGIKYIKKEEVQAETVIPRGSSIDDLILSVDSIVYIPNYGWSATMITVRMWGQRIKVLIPIRAGNDHREYLFDLEIMNEDVVLQRATVNDGAGKQ